MDHDTKDNILTSNEVLERTDGASNNDTMENVLKDNELVEQTEGASDNCTKENILTDNELVERMEQASEILVPVPSDCSWNQPDVQLFPNKVLEFATQEEKCSSEERPAGSGLLMCQYSFLPTVSASVILAEDGSSCGQGVYDSVLPIHETEVKEKTLLVEECHTPSGDMSLLAPELVEKQDDFHAQSDEMSLLAPELIKREVEFDTPSDEMSLLAPELRKTEDEFDTPSDEMSLLAPELIKREDEFDTPWDEMSLIAPELIKTEDEFHSPSNERPLPITEPVNEEDNIYPTLLVQSAGNGQILVQDVCDSVLPDSVTKSNDSDMPLTYPELIESFSTAALPISWLSLCLANSEKTLQFMKMYDNERGLSVAMSISIREDFTADVFIHRIKLSAEDALWEGLPTRYDSVKKVLRLLKRIEAAKICHGNPDPDYISQVTSRSHQRKNLMFYLEGDFGASDFSTIRSRFCSLLVDTKFTIRCKECRKVRGTLRSTRAKAAKASKSKTSQRVPNRCLKRADLERKCSQLQKYSEELESQFDRMNQQLSCQQLLEEDLKKHAKGSKPPGMKKQCEINSDSQKESDQSQHSSIVPARPEGPSQQTSYGDGEHYSLENQNGDMFSWIGQQLSHDEGVAQNSQEKTDNGKVLGWQGQNISDDDGGHNSLKKRNVDMFSWQGQHLSSGDQGLQEKIAENVDNTLTLQESGGRRKPSFNQMVLQTKSSEMTETSEKGTKRNAMSLVKVPKKLPKVVSQQYPRKTKPKAQYPRNTDSKGPYQCDVCHKIYNSKDSIKRHRHKLTHTGEKPYKCELCGKCFGQNGNLRRHSLVHKFHRPFQCPLCSKSFRSKEDLRIHSKRHTGKKPFLCQYCGRAFTQSGHMRRHEKTHTFQDGHKCDICGKNFSELSYLKRHEIMKHGGCFQCRSCDLTFKKEQDLIAHRLIHSGPKQFQCDQCPKSYLYEYMLKNHIVKVHVLKKPAYFACETCGKQFRQQVHLKMHMRSHSDERPISCQVCSKTFKYEVSLKNHMKTHTEITGDRQKYDCQLCGTQFTNTHNLQRHMKYIHDKKDRKQNHVCKICNEKFLTQTFLKKHNKVHHQESQNGVKKSPQLVPLLPYK